ncbi:recombinase family protein [Dermatophilaceae bacterium Soc4.6]
MSIEKPTDHTLLGYARVSTLEQHEALQVDALRLAGCVRVFTDKASGKLEHRPALDALLDQLRPGDTVAVWRLDRLGRSLRHLIGIVQALETRGVAFRSLTESIDTSTPGGRLIFHVFGALAEFEKDLIRERTMAGLTAARARGRTGGRPTVWTPEKVMLARQMYDSREHDVATIARVIGVSRASVYRALSIPEKEVTPVPPPLGLKV